MERVYEGTELKLNVSIDKIAGYTMDDYDFIAEFYCSQNRKLRLEKSALIRTDAANYSAVVDTRSLGVGVLKCKITAFLPDADCADGVRTEVCLMDTGINIVVG